MPAILTHPTRSPGRFGELGPGGPVGREARWYTWTLLACRRFALPSPGPFGPGEGLTTTWRDGHVH